MRRALFSCVVLALAFTGSDVVVRGQGRDLAGLYAVEGYELSGQPYSGTADISKDGETWSLHWTFGVGTAVGFGLLEGDVLAVICQFNTGGVCLATYRIVGDGPSLRLVGRWTVPGVAGVFDETLTRTRYLLSWPAAREPTAGNTLYPGA